MAGSRWRPRRLCGRVPSEGVMAPLSLLIAVLAIFGIVGSFNGSFGPGLRIGLTGAVTLMALVAALIWLAGGLGTGIR